VPLKNKGGVTAKKDRHVGTNLLVNRGSPLGIPRL